MSKFFVSHQEKQLGPYTVDEIVNLVQKEELSPLDYIYDQVRQDWILFMDHPDLGLRLRSVKPKRAPKPVEGPVPHAADPSSQAAVAEPVPKGPNQDLGPSGTQWFVLKGDNKFGPFTYPDVIKMLQQGVVYEFDFAWHEALSNWVRIAELPEFKPDRIRELKNNAKDKEISQVFFRRRHKRVKYGGTILIHDNKKVWKGQAVEMSEGGAGVVMDNSMVLPGQVLYLHFKPGDGVPPFNAVCEVVSKQFVSGLKDPKAPVRYGIKFKTISHEAEKVIREVTSRQSA
jgi:hypothetical protein